MTYKVIPGPKALSIEKGDFSEATNTYAALINSEAIDGWKFHSLESITTLEQTGCINKQVISTNIYMLIFYKE